MSEMSKDTLVKMADWSKRQITDVRIGDMLYNPYGSPKRVINIWRGREEDIIAIKTEKGEELLLTKFSVVQTSEGLHRVENLKVSDSLKKENGESEIIKSIEKKTFENEIYSLELERGMDELKSIIVFVIKDGFIVGDFATMQQTR